MPETPKPFLRWAGGKRWLLKHLKEKLPKSNFNAYHEPFLGGGSVYFFLNPTNAYLSDLNRDLIETYIAVKENVEGVIDELSKLQNTAECYYRIRQTVHIEPEVRAAQFIYLNQTSFNGIYRVNLHGTYNVPYGYRKKDFYDPNLLRVASKNLSNATLYHGDFSLSIQNIQENDLVFLDPPYTVTHNNNGFIQYNQKLFDLDSQYQLSGYIDKVKEKGAYYILTNAAHAKIEEIFRKDNDTMLQLDRASSIGGRNAKRGKYKEMLISNIF